MGAKFGDMILNLNMKCLRSLCYCIALSLKLKSALPPTHPPVRPAFPPSAWPAEPIYINSRSTAKQLLLVPHTTKVAIPSVCAPFMLPFIWLSDTACTQISNFPAEENSRKKKQKMKMKNQKKQKMKMKKKKQKMTTHRDEDDGSEEPQEPEERFQKKMVTVLESILETESTLTLRTLCSLYTHSTHSTPTQAHSTLTLHSPTATKQSSHATTFKSMFPRESLDLQSWSWLIVCQGAWEHTFRNMFWSICQDVVFILVNNELKQHTSLPPQ